MEMATASPAHEYETGTMSWISFEESVEHQRKGYQYSAQLPPPGTTQTSPWRSLFVAHNRLYTV